MFCMFWNVAGYSWLYNLALTTMGSNKFGQAVALAHCRVDFHSYVNFHPDISRLWSLWYSHDLSDLEKLHFSRLISSSIPVLLGVHRWRMPWNSSKTARWTASPRDSSLGVISSWFRSGGVLYQWHPNGWMVLIVMMTGWCINLIDGFYICFFLICLYDGFDNGRMVFIWIDVMDGWWAGVPRMDWNDSDTCWNQPAVVHVVRGCPGMSGDVRGCPAPRETGRRDMLF